MSPERLGKAGQFRSDWQRPEFGRQKVTHGRTVTEHRRALALLKELYDNAQLEVLRAYFDGRVTMHELLAAKKRKGHRHDDVLVNLRLNKPLWDTLEALANGLPASLPHKKSVVGQFSKVAASRALAALGPRPRVADLLRVDWRALRRETRLVPAKKKGAPPVTVPMFKSPYTWNFFRKNLLACIADLLGSAEHDWRVRLREEMGPKEKEPQAEIDVSPDLFWSLVRAAPEIARPGIVTLAITGMRLNTEYRRATATDLRPDIHAIHAPGSKTADAKGYVYVPATYWRWIEAGIPAPLQTAALRRHFKAAARAVGRPELTLHHLRHLYVMFLLEGGLAVHEAQAAARHADPAMTMRYARTMAKKRAAEAMEETLGTPVEPPDIHAQAKPGRHGRKGWTKRAG